MFRPDTDGIVVANCCRAFAGVIENPEAKTAHNGLAMGKDVLDGIKELSRTGSASGAPREDLDHHTLELIKSGAAMALERLTWRP